MSNNLISSFNSPLQNLFPSPIIAQRDPALGDKGYDIGQQWVNAVSFTYWGLAGYSAGVPQWKDLTNSSGGSGVFTSLSVTAGPAAFTLSAGGFTVTAGTQAVSIGADAADHTVAIGSATGSSALTVRGGSGASSIVTAGGSLAINTGVGALSISSDASATTVNVATGAAVKTVNIATGAAANVVSVGSTTGAASLALRSGSGGVNVTSPAAQGILLSNGTQSAQILVGTNSPNGAVTGLQGSIFLRVDGAADTILYVNTDGAQAWTALTST